MIAELPRRQREVLVGIAEGQTNKEIGYALGISIHTVKQHVTFLLDRLGANDRAHAVAIGYQTGLLR